jgi:photosystem II stability/assembly factor-like uncharacterized protein
VRRNIMVLLTGTLLFVAGCGSGSRSAGGPSNAPSRGSASSPHRSTTASPHVTAAEPLPVTQRERLRLSAASTAPTFQGPVQFLSSTVGYAWATDGTSVQLMSTTDGGHVWNRVEAAPGITGWDAVSSHVIWMTACQTAACTIPRVLERTSDGGTVWHPVPLPLASATVDQIDFISREVGWVEESRPSNLSPLGHPALYYTADGGQTWTHEALPAPSFGLFTDTVDLATPRTGWLLAGSQPAAGTQEKTLYYTTDAGQSWTAIARSGSHTLPAMGYNAALTFATSRVGYLALARGPLMRTIDGGYHWAPVAASPLQPEAGSPMTGLSFLNATTGYAMDGSRIWETTDGGVRWTPLGPRLQPIGAVSFGSSAQGLAVGFAGNFTGLLRTQDGGRVWAPVGNPATIWQTVHMVDTHTVWGIQYTGAARPALVVSRTGGRYFRTVALPTGDTVAALGLTSSQAGYVVVVNHGQRALLRTTDGGTGWHKKSVPFAPYQFTQSASRDLWAIGMTDITPELFHSNDGGTTWSAYNIPQAVANPVIPQGLAFVTPRVGYFWTPTALYVTHNGGTSWQQETAPNNVTIDGIDLQASGQGWLTTTGGLYQTVDGGRTWTRS